MIALDKELSDHSPVLLSSVMVDFGRLPFRFFNSWTDRDGFKQVITAACPNFKGFRSPDSFFSAKLRHLKNAIKEWRRREFGKEQENLNQIKNRVWELDTLAKTRPLTAAENGQRDSRKSEIWKGN